MRVRLNPITGRWIPRMIVDKSLQDREKRAWALFNEEGFFEGILDSLSHGRTLSEIAEKFDIPYFSLVEYVDQDKARQERTHAAYQMGARYIVDQLMRETREISQSDFRKLFGEDGQLLSVNEWPDGAAKTVESVEVKELFENDRGKRKLVGYTKKIKLWNKNQAGKTLGQEFGIFKDKKEVGFDDDLKAMLARSYKKELENKEKKEIEETSNGENKSGSVEE